MNDFLKFAISIVVWTLVAGLMAGGSINPLAVFGVWLFGFVWITGFIISGREGADHLALYTFAPPVILVVVTLIVASIVS